MPLSNADRLPRCDAGSVAAAAIVPPVLQISYDLALMDFLPKHHQEIPAGLLNTLCSPGDRSETEEGT
jgi:hypothetical protein